MTPAETTNRQTNKPNMNAPEQLPLTDGPIAAYSPVAAGLRQIAEVSTEAKVQKIAKAALAEAE